VEAAFLIRQAPLTPPFFAIGKPASPIHAQPAGLYWHRRVL
jgi:hypothetical protein